MFVDMTPNLTIAQTRTQSLAVAQTHSPSPAISTADRPASLFGRQRLREDDPNQTRGSKRFQGLRMTEVTYYSYATDNTGTPVSLSAILDRIRSGERGLDEHIARLRSIERRLPDATPGQCDICHADVGASELNEWGQCADRAACTKRYHEGRRNDCSRGTLRLRWLLEGFVRWTCSGFGVPVKVRQAEEEEPMHELKRRPTKDGMATRILCQIVRGLDRAHLLPSLEKRRRALAEKLDREMERNGWRIFVSGSAHTMPHGKAPAKCNAEIMLVAPVQRWYDDVVEFLPERPADLERIVRAGFASPAPPPNRNREGD